MKKTCIIFILLSVIAAALVADEKQIITVLDFQTNNVSAADMRSIISVISSKLFETGKYTVIDVHQRNTILEELAFSLSDCSDEKCQLEIGRMLSAELIVVGDIGLVGGQYVLSAKLLETETSRTVSTATSFYTELKELLDDIGDFTNRLAGMQVPQQEAFLTATERRSFKEMSTNRIIAWSSLGAGVITTGISAFLMVRAVDFKQNTVDVSYAAYKDDSVTDYGGLTAEQYFDNLWDQYTSDLTRFRTKSIVALGIAGLSLASYTVSTVFFLRPEKDHQVSFLLQPYDGSVKVSMRLCY